MAALALPRAERLHSRAGAALILATTMASMAAFLDANVVNVAVPAIQRDLHASVIALQWILTGYLVTVAALLLVAGALADRFGRRRILLIGLGVMLIASVLCAIAPSSGALVAARIVQGVGAALVTPSSLSLLNGTLRVEDRARAIGIWAGLATIGTTLGPYLGGWLVDNASWRAVFLLNLPLTLVGIFALRPVPESRGRIEQGGIDYAGGLLTAVGIGGLIYALTEGAASGWGRANVLIAGILGVSALAALAPFERHRTTPLVRLSLFRSRQFDAINATTLLFYGALAAGGYLLVLQAQLRLGYSAAAAGALMIPNTPVFLALAPISGALVARFGPRWLMVAGILLVAVAFAWLSALSPGDDYVTAVLPAALLYGAGLGLAVTPLTAAVLAAVSDRDLGEASAVNDAAARFGAVIAIALVPALIGVSAGGLAHALVNGYQPAMIALAIVSVASAVITACFVSRQPGTAPSFASPHRGCALATTEES